MSNSSLASVSISGPLQKACAFIATGFGFGPISKAISIAQELKAQAPHLEAHYFGGGIDYDYARKSGAFDKLCKADVDQPAVLNSLLPQLASYQAVFSVLNLELLPLWSSRTTPLYFVDSLAWMWPSAPAGLENVAAYFVQDYFMPLERLRQWEIIAPVVLVPPIETASHAKLERVLTKSNQLLVNFSGCANPFAPPELYEKYTSLLASAILEQVETRFERVIFCCNERLTAYLRQQLSERYIAHIGHFTHEEFLHLLNSSSRVLSAPGITTTLEALALQVPVRFLLPQNDSQALLSEQYRLLLGDDACMAFSRFGPEFYYPPFLPAREGVELALAHLRTILDTRQSHIRSMVHEMLTGSQIFKLDRLRKNINHPCSTSGQRLIIQHVLSSLNDESSVSPRSRIISSWSR